VAAAPASSAPTDLLPDGFDPGRAPFDLHFGDTVVGYKVLAIPVTPGAVVPVAVMDAPAGTTFSAEAHGGTLEALDGHTWRFTAPRAPGLYPIAFRSSAEAGPVTVNVFVVHPYHPGLNIVDGYDIGRYPNPSASPKHAEAYDPPIGFMQVDSEDAATPVSPHFTLGQFACKQGGAEWPKFVALRPALFVKLETALQAVNARGIDTPAFTVMSGFRTRVYNAGLGNVNLSRHTFGDASDIFVDADHDGIMDDLNHDGRHDWKDAVYLAGIIEASPEQPPYEPVAGGLGTYGPTRAHGPFVHVDARGFRARWVG
jgi:hypothetical protein